MLGFWEVIIVLSIIGWGLYSYLGKASQNQLKKSGKAALEEEELIDLDESSYEILEEEGDD